jgi:hypothetical protein
MSDDSTTTRKEETEVFEELKKAIPSVIKFIPDYYGNGDILVFAVEVDIYNATLKDIANATNENYDLLLNLMRNTKHCSYCNDPYGAVRLAVCNSSVKYEHQDLLIKYIYNNLYNRR